MHVLVVLTYGVSLKDWEDNGLLDREMKLYEKLSKDRDVHFTFLSFGNSEDSNIVKNFNVIPVYEHIEKGVCIIMANHQEELDESVKIHLENNV